MDHPRSRGVYWDSRLPEETAAGSSPLARGLPQPGGHLRDSRGIIPARAGFTRVITREEEKSPDHPRSRGVYAPVGGPDEVGVGSSPLARGLPGTGAARWARRRDHPRSRGVYSWEPSITGCTRGSSPLARGLPRRRPGSPVRRRIIPARAGFTYVPWSPPSGAWDHPRSRGVYTGGTSCQDRASGSSPLARGLLLACEETIGVVRIIPARAGFTRRRGTAEW